MLIAFLELIYAQK